MGLRPKPYLVKVATGNPGKQKLNPGPKYGPFDPKCPTGMSRHGKAIFKRLKPVLMKVGLLNESTVEAYHGLCFAYDKAMSGETVSERDKGWQQFRLWCVEWGLTPAAAQKIPTESKDVSLEELMGIDRSG